jgi:hypothetical protein
MHTLTKSILPLCLLLTFAGAAAAQETVCDGQTGAAYGLCTAFCEAMDCDGDDPQASQTACDKVGAKFLTITGQNPPCAVSACPCTSIPGFNDVLAGANSCLDVRPAGALYVYAQNSFDPPYVFINPGSGGFCGYTEPFSSRLLTEEQSTACLQLFLDAIASRGLTCSKI